jgi:glycosyltransferase 2 family protein
MKDKLPIFLKTAVSLGLLVFIFTRIDLNQVWSRLQFLSFPFVVFALCFYTGCQWLSCLRWQVVLKSAGYHIPIHYLLSSYFAGMFVSIFLPSSVGGDVYRVYRITKAIDAPEVAFASVFLERFTGLAAVFALALVGIPPALKIIGSLDIILLFLVCSSIIWGGFLLIASPLLLSWSRPWLSKIRLGGMCDRLDKVQLIVIQYLKHRQSLGLAITLSFIIQLSVIFYQYLLAQQLQIPISYLELLVFTPISIVVTLMPISLGGLGIQEGLWAYLFTRIGLTAEQAVLLSLTFTILGWVLALPGAIILLLDSKGLRTTK